MATRRARTKYTINGWTVRIRYQWRRGSFCAYAERDSPHTIVIERRRKVAAFFLTTRKQAREVVADFRAHGIRAYVARMAITATVEDVR